MATKRKTAVESSSSGTSKTKQSKRQVSKDTFLKWQRTYEKEHQSMTWLRAEVDGQDRSLVLSRLKDENGGKVYLGSELHHFRDTTTNSCADQALADLKSLDDRMRARLEWSDVDLMRSILLFLDTQSWQDSDGSSTDDRLSEIKAAVVSITDVFRAPLEAKGADLTSILDEIEDIVDYARTYLRIGSDSYSKVWYQLYSSPDSAKWPNIMLVPNLAVAVRSLNDLLEVNTEGPTLSNFCADAAVNLWWSDCSSGRRVNQKPRKEYRKRKQSSSTVADTSDDSESENELDLDTWDDWFHTDSPDSPDSSD